MNPFSAAKIFCHPDRLAAAIRREPCPPVTFEIDPTNACNHRCPRCAGGRANADQLAKAEALDYLRQIAGVGAKAVTFTGGGEPLCHPDLLAMVSTAAALGLDVGFITNGGLLTPDIADVLLALCCWLRVSLDAADPHNYRRSHGMDRDEFDAVLRHIDLLGQRKTALKSPCTLGVGFLADAHNRSGIPDMARRLAGTGVDYLQIRPFHRRPVEVAAEIDAARAAETPTFRVVSSAPKYAAIDQARDYDYCYGAEVCGVIQADSGVPLCCHLRGDPRGLLGRLRDGQTLREIWYGPRKREVLAALDVGQCLPLCRCDPTNRTVAAASPIEHANFL